MWHVFADVSTPMRVDILNSFANRQGFPYLSKVQEELQVAMVFNSSLVLLVVVAGILILFIFSFYQQASLENVPVSEQFWQLSSCLFKHQTSL